MSKLRQRVKDSFKWKKSDLYCAKKIGISIEKYREIRSEIRGETGNFNYSETVDLNKGSGKLEITTSTEPKSPEDIIKLLNIDTSKWKLSSYWNKQMSDGWRVSALVTKLSEEDHLKEFLESWVPKKQTLPNGFVITASEKACAVLSLQDIHFGKQNNDDVEDHFKKAVYSLISKAINHYHLEKIYYVIGGDLINMDTFNGESTAGTPQNLKMDAIHVYERAFDVLSWAIQYLSLYCDELVVIHIPGNHDRLTSYHMAHALSKSFNSPKIKWDIDYKERKAHVYGNVMNCFEHGDAPSKTTPLVYATEFSEEWGKTKVRNIFTGHYHKSKKVEHIVEDESVGVTFKILPSLSALDYWHYHKKFVGSHRAAKLEIQDPEMGTVAEYTYRII